MKNKLTTTEKIHINSIGKFTKKTSAMLLAVLYFSIGPDSNAESEIIQPYPIIIDDNNKIVELKNITEEQKKDIEKSILKLAILISKEKDPKKKQELLKERSKLYDKLGEKEQQKREKKKTFRQIINLARLINSEKDPKKKEELIEKRKELFQQMKKFGKQSSAIILMLLALGISEETQAQQIYYEPKLIILDNLQYTNLVAENNLPYIMTTKEQESFIREYRKRQLRKSLLEKKQTITRQKTYPNSGSGRIINELSDQIKKETDPEKIDNLKTTRQKLIDNMEYIKKEAQKNINEIYKPKNIKFNIDKCSYGQYKAKEINFGGFLGENSFSATIKFEDKENLKEKNVYIKLGFKYEEGKLKIYIVTDSYFRDIGEKENLVLLFDELNSSYQKKVLTIENKVDNKNFFVEIEFLIPAKENPITSVP